MIKNNLLFILLSGFILFLVPHADAAVIIEQTSSPDSFNVPITVQITKYVQDFATSTFDSFAGTVPTQVTVKIFTPPGGMFLTAVFCPVTSTYPVVNAFGFTSDPATPDIFLCDGGINRGTVLVTAGSTTTLVTVPFTTTSTIQTGKRYGLGFTLGSTGTGFGFFGIGDGDSTPLNTLRWDSGAPNFFAPAGIDAFFILESESTFIPVSIDIKPGSDLNSINLGSNGVIPVVIFGSATFDVKQVDPATIKLANSSIQFRGNDQPMASYLDVNEDSFIDIVVQVSTKTLQLTESDVTADLEGQLISGAIIKGSDSVRIVP